jgi:signal-transduction protein with cAMP-binding, CBS, and nucleotidyltransferase domain
MMSNIKEILNKSKVFDALDEDSIERLADLFDKWEIHPGDTLTNTNDTAHTFFLIGEGTVLLEMDEGKSVILDTPGDFIGLELLSAKGLYKTTLSVLEKGYVFVVPRQVFLDIIQEDSVAAATIMASWQEYLEVTASFAKNSEDAGLLQQF